MEEIVYKQDEVMYHTLDPETALRKLGVTEAGLTADEVSRRQARFGKNALEEGKQKTKLAMFIEQFKDVMIIILLLAAVISGLTHDLTDSMIILAVVILNAVLGVMQESKAEKALAALKKMSAPHAKVKRAGEVINTKSEELVPGDLVLLEAGDFVPADMRLIQQASLKLEEAALTGESVPVEKITDSLERPDLVIGDRRNMAYSGSSVSYGRGLGVVTATGMATEVGKIAGHLTGLDQQQTPLQKKLAELSKFLTIGIIIISVVIFATGVLKGRNYLDMLLVAISLAVAAIPEGLPAVITIVLALGVQKMAHRNAIIRKLSAVETLGSTEIICSDKTGTLTQNKMTVQEIYLDNQRLAAGALTTKQSSAELLLKIIVLCNDSKVSANELGQAQFLGDPTETALVSYGLELGFSKPDLELANPRTEEIPFDSERKLMSTINQVKHQAMVMTKGAPDVLLGRCSKVLLEGRVEDLTREHQDTIERANHAMAGQALRVLAAAYKELGASPVEPTSEQIEKDLIFVGLVGMIDPPRPEAKEAVRICTEAGIRPIMITGDHRDTAAAIAKELNLIQDESQVIIGSDLAKLTDQEFKQQVMNYSVYARVSPEHKVRIVQAWKEHNKVVAMTGDGVNDAPALKAADIGIGMGITGTDVAKGVANMVLADDNFATIVVAVEEGRKVYGNIRKTIQFLLSSNFGEIVTLFLGTMLNWTVLLPIHILWVNLVTDSLPALALGVEKAEQDIMRQKPRNARSSFFSEGFGISILYQGLFEGLLTLAAYYYGLTHYTPETATTMAFATLAFIQLAHSFNVRSVDKSIFRLRLFSNPYLWGAIALTICLQVIVLTVPYLQEVFHVTSLNLEQWLIVIGTSLTIIPIAEIGKVFLRKAK